MKPFAIASTLLALLLSIAGTAVAEPATDVSPSRHGTRKSPLIATLASLVPTLAGSALIGSALLVVDDPDSEERLLLGGLATLTVGPSFGQFYAGAPGRGLATMGVRAGGAAILCAAAYTPGLTDDDGGKAVDALFRIIALAAGAQLVVGGTVVGVVDAPRAARRHNRSLGLVPTLVPTATGMAPGLLLGGTF